MLVRVYLEQSLQYGQDFVLYVFINNFIIIHLSAHPDQTLQPQGVVRTEKSPVKGGSFKPTIF